jgi:hypothetical protein
MSTFQKGCLAFMSLLCAELCAAAVIHNQVEHPRHLRQIHGKVTGYGAINPGVEVRVFDNAQVWLDGSFPMQEKKNRRGLPTRKRTDAGISHYGPYRTASTK